MTPREEGYVNAMKKSAKEKILYGSQVFSLEEMSELKDAIDSSIFKKIKRVENEALVQIMNDFIRGIVSEPKRLKENPQKKNSLNNQTAPCSIIESATFLKPAMFAPITKFPSSSNSFEVS